MKVTIDTKQDDYDDIQKVLNILTHILETKNKEEKINPSINTDTANMMDMFNSSNEKEKSVEKTSECANFPKSAKATVKDKSIFDSKIEFF